MNNSVRNDAQRYGIAAIFVAVVVLAIFYLLAKSGLGSPGATAASAGTGAGMASPMAEPSPTPTM